MPYRLEYASTGRAGCKGKCKEKLAKGRLRFGTEVTIVDHPSWQYRCLRCVTARQVSNIHAFVQEETGSTTDYQCLLSFVLGHNGHPSSLCVFFLLLLVALYTSFFFLRAVLRCV
jgi:Poly(ADP-ribose) polymerase and DNA-Ligase Zn-finger region